MKPVNENLHDRFHKESVEGFDAVLDRLMNVLGGPWPGNIAVLLDVSENTLKTWRRRGAISMKYLQGFAADHGVSLDYLLRGEGGDKANAPITDEERLLLDRYRASPRDLRDAALRVLLGGGEPAPKARIKNKVSGTANSVVGINEGDINVGKTKARPGGKRRE